MKEAITKRLEELKAEHSKGEQLLRERQRQVEDLKVTLLRIEGAIDALEEIAQSS